MSFNDAGYFGRAKIYTHIIIILAKATAQPMSRNETAVESRAELLLLLLLHSRGNIFYTFHFRCCTNLFGNKSSQSQPASQSGRQTNRQRNRLAEAVKKMAQWIRMVIVVSACPSFALRGCVGHVGNFVQVELLFIIFSDVSWVGVTGAALCRKLCHLRQVQGRRASGRLGRGVTTGDTRSNSLFILTYCGYESPTT